MALRATGNLRQLAYPVKLFSDDLDYEKKLDSLENEFKISVTKELSGEVLNVCNLSTGVYNRGYGSGYGSGYGTGYGAGYGSGKSDGKTEQAKETAHELHAMGMPVEQIARAVKVSVESVQQWLAEPQAT